MCSRFDIFTRKIYIKLAREYILGEEALHFNDY